VLPACWRLSKPSSAQPSASSGMVLSWVSTPAIRALSGSAASRACAVGCGGHERARRHDDDQRDHRTRHEHRGRGEPPAVRAGGSAVVEQGAHSVGLRRRSGRGSAARHRVRTVPGHRFDGNGRRPLGSVEPAPYLSAATVATVIVDEFVGPTRARCSKAVTPELAPGAAEYTLTPLARHADGSVMAFATAIENWYDPQMGRVAGYHKRWIKRSILVIAAPCSCS
jgi:hypothetical protein